MARRGATDLSGILPIDKPSGMTSHDVVAAVRRITGEKRVGHAGTLDPAATGVLVVLVGPATRLAPYLTAARKSYDARIIFGSETDTDDAEGILTRSESVPDAVRTEQGAAAHVAALVGTHEQVPPAYSAIKRDGVTAHRAARVGRALVLEPRTIEIVDAFLTGVEPGPPAAWNVSLVVSKGTYIRALARDLGRELGTAAHLGALRRTASGPITLADTTTLDEVATAGRAGIEARFMRSAKALDLPHAEVGDAVAAVVTNGGSLELSVLGELRVEEGQGVGLVHDGRTLAVYEHRGEALRPATVFPGGIT